MKEQEQLSISDVNCQVIYSEKSTLHVLSGLCWQVQVQVSAICNQPGHLSNKRNTSVNSSQ
jgi:hypothetical protein